MMRRVPLHPFLLALIPISFLYIRNRGEMVAGEALLPVVVVAAGVAALFGLGMVLWREAHLAAAITSLAVIVLLWYGPIRAALEGVLGVLGLSLRHRYTLLLLLVALAAGATLLLRHRKAARAATGPMNTFCLILLAMLAIQLGTAEWSRVRALRAVGPLAPAGADAGGAVVADTAPRRSIYHIVLDGYAREDVLREVFSFDNSGFTDALRARGFHVNPDSRSNYPTTILSLASALNATHLTGLAALGTPGDQPADRIIPFDMIRKNRVMRFLGERGYRIVNLASGWGGTEAIPVADLNIRCGPSEFMETLLRQTAAWPVVADGFKEDVYQLRLCQLERLAQTPDLPGPKFVLAHLLLPHPPYVFGADGERLAGELTALGDESPWRLKERYIDQLRFVNRVLLPVLDSIIDGEDPDPVIILQSDHGPASSASGPWRASDTTLVRERMSILNALYLPGADGAAGREYVTPVNTFPLLLRRYLGARWPRSPDASYFSPNDEIYRFTRVDSLLTAEGHPPRTATAPAAPPP